MEVLTKEYKPIVNKPNKFRFVEDIHKYYYGEKELSSVSSVVHLFTRPFPEQLIASKISKKMLVETGEMVSSDEIIEGWHLKRDRAANYGSWIHYLLEKNINRIWLNNKPCKKITINKGVFGQDKSEIEAEVRKVVQKTLRWIKVNLVNKGYNIVDTELMMYDIRLGIAGTLDLLVEKEGEYYIIDFKTNKKNILIDDYGTRLLDIFYGLRATTFNKYVIQLNMYQILFERMTGLKIKDRFIMHCTSSGIDYRSCDDYSKELEGKLKEIVKYAPFNEIEARKLINVDYNN